MTFDQERALELDHASISVVRDADFIALHPPAWIARNREYLIEARERLNDALAKAERA